MERDLKIAEAVTVVARFAELRAAYVESIDRRGRNFVARYHGHILTGRIGILREGVTWCRGHSGPEVEALAAAQALR